MGKPNQQSQQTQQVTTGVNINLLGDPITVISGVVAGLTANRLGDDIAETVQLISNPAIREMTGIVLTVGVAGTAFVGSRRVLSWLLKDTILGGGNPRRA